MASWFRFVVLSRPVLLQELQVNAVCGVCWVGRGEKKRGKKRRMGWGREREGRGGLQFQFQNISLHSPGSNFPRGSDKTIRVAPVISRIRVSMATGRDWQI